MGPVTGSGDIREFEPHDYRGILEVYNTLFPEHRQSLEEIRHFDENWDRARYAFKRYVGLNTRGEVSGFAEYGHSPSVFHPQKFWMDVNVHPDWQRQGIGTSLYDHLLEQLRGREAIELRSSARENMPESLHFLQKRGFMEKMRTWENVLTLGKFEASPLRRYIDSLEGVEITSLAKEESRPNLYKDLHELQNTLMKDVPMPGKFTPVSFDMFMAWMKTPGHLPQAYLLAKVGDEYIGQCTLERQLEVEGGLTHGLTGVVREHRGRGIAMALKATALEWAKKAGYSTVRTWNDSTNEGMLAINEKLGFQKEPAWITFVKDMERE